MTLDPDDDGWHHELLTLREPYVSLFRESTAQRYDLLARIATVMRLPGRDLGWEAERFLAHLYDLTAEAWRCGTLSDDRERSRSYAKVALSNLDLDDLGGLIRDLGWAGNLTIREHLFDTYEAQVRRATAGRLARPVQRLTRKLVDAGKSSASVALDSH